jgi:hypothetical protein
MRATSKSAVLLQWRNECFRPIGFHSAISWQITFTSTAHNLAVIRIVLLKFQHLLKGAELEIWSDKKGVVDSLLQKMLHRQAAHLLTIMDYFHLWSHGVSIYYQKPRSSSLLKCADSLSRGPILYQGQEAIASPLRDAQSPARISLP